MTTFKLSEFGDVSNDALANTRMFQQAINSLGKGDRLEVRGQITLTKDTDFMPDVYGGQHKLYSSAANVYTEGGQSCLIVPYKKKIQLDLEGAELITDIYGQGIIDILHSESCSIWGGKFTGGGYIADDDRYCWIPLDGMTGRGEKGGSVQGFNTTTLNVGIDSSRNNQFNLAHMTQGGYGGNFPQFDGSVAKTWGTWRGGQIGCLGHGITIIGGGRIGIFSNEFHGFNGNGINLGIQRSLDGKKDYPRVSTEETRKLTPVGVYIAKNHFHDNYVGGVHIDRAISVYGEYNTYANLGHPNASVAHQYVDPGYGISTGRAMPCIDYHFVHETMIDCKRKGFDTHQGTGFSFTKSTITGTLMDGIGIAIDDDYVDPFYQPYNEHIANISYNNITSHTTGIMYSNGQFGRKRCEEKCEQWETAHINIEGNVIRSTQPFYYNYGHSPINIKGNSFIYACPAYHQKPPDPTAAIYLGSLARGITIADIVKDNKFYNSKDGNFAWFIKHETSANDTKAPIIADNLFNVTPWTYVEGVNMEYAHDDVKVRSGMATQIIFNNGHNAQDAIIKDNIVQSEMLHKLYFKNQGNGTGCVGYIKTDVNNRVCGVQLLSGGTNYSPDTIVGVSDLGRSKGCRLKPVVIDGVIKSIQVLDGGSFYRTTYNFSVPYGLSYFDMSAVSGTCALDTGHRKSDTTTGSSLYVTKRDMGMPDSPFDFDGKVKVINTNAVTGQFANYNSGMLGGSVALWVKVASGHANKQSAIFSMAGSYDEVSNGNINCIIEHGQDGFTLTSPLPCVNGKPYIVGSKLPYDTWHFIGGGNSGWTCGDISFGAKRLDSNFGLTAKFANITISKGYTFKPEELADLMLSTRPI